ncbi:hypothetical protein [Frigidibacter sp. SD6-1]|uniref:hypothetical protein n=1 Tax=Frigidibacter sp. SD6-1 TaxID=3032581 RepID=UPI0024DFF4E0|nr:hypothetical protein [Frigidibacter sp. SD6-1]
MIEDNQGRNPRRPEEDTHADAAGAARLRRAIDTGNAADKVDYPDPAAAPLGTDAEAAGTPPTDEQVRLAESEEVGRAPASPEPGVPRHQAPVLSPVLPPILWLVLAFCFLLAASAWLL